jgi:hypothetical protein
MFKKFDYIAIIILILGIIGILFNYPSLVILARLCFGTALLYIVLKYIITFINNLK